MAALAPAIDDRETWSWPVGSDWPQGARALVSQRADGDLAVSGPPDVLRRARLALMAPLWGPEPPFDRRWSWLQQVHGAEVVVVGDDPVEGATADALITDRPGRVLAVHTADCGPVALASPEGVVGAVHAGWRGLEAGVLAAAAAAMVRLGASRIDGWLGPCIHPGCYEFGSDDLGRLADRFGSTVVGRTADGNPALDLPGLVAAAAAGAGIELVGRSPSCTACDTRYHSHRARAEPGRQALVVWSDAP